jgi:hypothetical protein
MFQKLERMTWRDMQEFDCAAGTGEGPDGWETEQL